MTAAARLFIKGMQQRDKHMNDRQLPNAIFIINKANTSIVSLRLRNNRSNRARLRRGPPPLARNQRRQRSAHCIVADV